MWLGCLLQLRTNFLFLGCPYPISASATSMDHCYRPLRSCEGYVFTPVCLSTGRGGLPQCRDTTPLGAGTPRADTPQEQASPPRSRPPQSRNPREQTPTGSRPPRDQAPPQANGYCCGRYASYWNTFLFPV